MNKCRQAYIIRRVSPPPQTSKRRSRLSSLDSLVWSAETIGSFVRRFFDCLQVAPSSCCGVFWQSDRTILFALSFAPGLWMSKDFIYCGTFEDAALCPKYDRYESTYSDREKLTCNPVSRQCSMRSNFLGSDSFYSNVCNASWAFKYSLQIQNRPLWRMPPVFLLIDVLNQTACKRLKSIFLGLLANRNYASGMAYLCKLHCTARINVEALLVTHRRFEWGLLLDPGHANWL